MMKAPCLLAVWLLSGCTSTPYADAERSQNTQGTSEPQRANDMLRPEDRNLAKLTEYANATPGFPAYVGEVDRSGTGEYVITVRSQEDLDTFHRLAPDFTRENPSVRYKIDPNMSEGFLAPRFP